MQTAVIDIRIAGNNNQPINPVRLLDLLDRPGYKFEEISPDPYDLEIHDGPDQAAVDQVLADNADDPLLDPWSLMQSIDPTNPPDGVTINGLILTITQGPEYRPGLFAEGTDSVDFGPPVELDRAVAVDIVKDDQGVIQFQPYTWDPATEVKGDPDPADTVLAVDVIRGVLAAGGDDLSNLEVE